MATSKYFNLYNNQPEQDLVADLVTESIHIYGYNVAYIPREPNSPDKIYHEDTSSEYNSNYLIEMYIKNVAGFEGNGAVFSPYGYEIRQGATFVVSIQQYNSLIGQYIQNSRPREGDLLFFDLDNKLFVIKKVNKYSMFFQVGALQVYDLECELFEYSNEIFRTGIDFVDNIEQSLSLSTAKWGTRDANNVLVKDQTGFPVFANTFNFNTPLFDLSTDNTEIKTGAQGVVDFSETNPFGVGI